MSDRKYLKKNPFQMNSFPSTRQPSGASNLRSIHSQISNAVVDYSPWMRQQRRSQKSAATTTTATNIATLPRKINFNRLFSHEMKQFSCRLALHEERKCSGRCRHLRKQPTPERFAPENPAKIQWLTLELHSNSFFSQSKRSSLLLLFLLPSVYRTRIQAFVQREHELEENNRKLRESISNIEHSAHDTVAANLRRFDQYQV